MVRSPLGYATRTRDEKPEGLVFCEIAEVYRARVLYQVLVYPMIFEEFERTPTFVIRGLFMALAVVWMLLPEQAVAYSNSGESAFVPFSGCVDFGFAEMSSSAGASALSSRAGQTISRTAGFSAQPSVFSSVTSSSSSELLAGFTPCEDEDRDADPQYNICFEGNPAPISTLPHLLAGLQAERASWIVMKTVAEYSASFTHKNGSVVLGVDGARMVSGGVERKAAPVNRSANRGATCSPNGDLCSSLPGVPGHFDIGSVSPVLVPEGSVCVPSLEVVCGRSGAQDLWARLRVGPASEHRLRVDEPPIVFSRSDLKSYIS